MPGTTYDYTSFYPSTGISSPQAEPSAADSTPSTAASSSRQPEESTS
ncbi:MAG: hypothetical protein IJK49_01730 [Prevotella sp.]|nr:hypothetical protein [Prevotella sp.]